MTIHQRVKQSCHRVGGCCHSEAKLKNPYLEIVRYAQDDSIASVCAGSFAQKVGVS